MLKIPQLEIGKTYTKEKVVTKEDIAIKYGKVQLDNLFATQNLIALVIETSKKLLDNKLPNGFLTVSKVIQLNHLEPTVLGQVLRINIEIKDYDNYFIKLNVKVYDDSGLVANGYHEKFIANKEKLLKYAEDRRKNK